MTKRTKRLLGAICLAASTIPNLGWREATSDDPIITGSIALDRVSGGSHPGDPISVAGVWVLRSEDVRFGGYSALLALPGKRLLAISDSGRTLEFSQPPGVPNDKIADLPNSPDRTVNDLESAARSPDGSVWIGVERANRIRRYTRDLATLAEALPPQMQDFADNGGAESLTRLPDGRFVVIAEDASWRYPLRRTALLFADDPVVDDRAMEFTFRPPTGYDASDAASLPDGRVLILVRGISAKGPPFISSRLLVADSADIRAGKDWPWTQLVDLDALIPRENYEGVAVRPLTDGHLEIWLISDDNHSAVVQRTLLARLVWKDWRITGAAAP